MLVLSRQRDETVVLTTDTEQVEVTVVDIRGDKVRLGTKAAEHFAVYRIELYQQIMQRINDGEKPPENRARKGDGMLVLARVRDETLMYINTRLGVDGWKKPFSAVTVVDVRGDKVRLGFNADTAVAIHRREVFDAIQREKQNC